MRRLSFLLAVVLFAAACHVAGPSTNVTETFTGTVAPVSNSTFNFDVKGSGEFWIKIVSLNPAATVGIGFGVRTSSGCGMVQFNDFATAGATALTNSIVQGAYCAGIYDSGQMTTTVSYTITVNHP